jgi:hypothetical protein
MVGSTHSIKSVGHVESIENSSIVHRPSYVVQHRSCLEHQVASSSADRQVSSRPESHCNWFSHESQFSTSTATTHKRDDSDPSAVQRAQRPKHRLPILKNCPASNIERWGTLNLAILIKHYCQAIYRLVNDSAIPCHQSTCSLPHCCCAARCPSTIVRSRLGLLGL